LDHGVWSKRADKVIGDAVAAYKASGATGKLGLWVAGTVSALAKQQLQKRGIQVTEDVDVKVGFMD
jgi:hypothetical protein